MRFVPPAILAGENALAAAVVGAAVIALVIIYLAHGRVGADHQRGAGTLVALALTALLAVTFVERHPADRIPRRRGYTSQGY